MKILPPGLMFPYPKNVMADEFEFGESFECRVTKTRGPRGDESGRGKGGGDDLPYGKDWAGRGGGADGQWISHQ